MKTKDLENLRNANADFAIENERLNQRMQELKNQNSLYASIIKEHANAASIFQPSGKYHKEADLPLGSSCVIEGIAWMDQQISELKSENENLRSRLYVAEQRNIYLRLANESSEKRHLEEIQGWENKWQCAVEIAAIAENKLDVIKKIL